VLSEYVTGQAELYTAPQAVDWATGAVMLIFPCRLRRAGAG